MIFILSLYLFITVVLFVFSMLYYAFKTLVDSDEVQAANGLRIALRAPIWPVLIYQFLKERYGEGNRA